MKINKKILVITFSIVLVLITMTIGTYSLFYKEHTATNPSSYSTGLLQIEALSLSDNISLDNALPQTDEDALKEQPYIFSIKNTGNIDYKFNVKLLSTSSNTINPNYIKVKIDDNDPVLLSSLTNSIIKEDIIVKAKESINITLRVWLSIDTPNTEIGKTFTSQIVIDGQSIYTTTNYDPNNNTELPKGPTIAEYITNLYTNASKTKAQNNGIDYNYASSESLMNDRLGGTTTDLDGGNIRYYGASPNNYIYFNCETYPDTNCELWRIIGVFNNQVKIIRNEQIGVYSWDTSASGVNSGNGENEWPEADLMKLLNPGYDNESVGGSLYYNSGSGNCYTGRSNATTTCNFTSSGIKNKETRDKIAEVTWNLGGWNSNSIFPNQIYGYERGTTVYSERSTTWIGKVALPYPSDYGYATDFNKCSQNLYHYDNSSSSYACRTNDWMYPIITNSGNNVGWLLTPDSGSADGAFSVRSAGYVNYNNYYVYQAIEVAPVLYLSSEQVIESGEGSQNSPYKLG